MRTDITVRAAVSADVCNISRFDGEVFDEAWGEEFFASCVASEHHTLLCAVDANGELLGFVLASHVAGEAEIMRIAVDALHRRRGLGGDMLDALISARRDASDEVIFLEVRTSNSSATALYASRSFKQYATRKNYYKNPVEDAVLMRFDIDA